jgi:hypothetical protein
VSATGPAQEYLHALNRELRVGRRYRRRVLQELAGHIEDAAARERGLGLSADQAQRRAVERLGSIGTVAERISTATLSGVPDSDDVPGAPRAPLPNCAEVSPALGSAEGRC